MFIANHFLASSLHTSILVSFSAYFDLKVAALAFLFIWQGKYLFEIIPNTDILIYKNQSDRTLCVELKSEHLAPLVKKE